MLDLQFAIARTLQAYDEDGDAATRERELEAAHRQLRNGLSGLTGREDETTPKS